MAKVEVDEAGLAEFVSQNKPLRDMLVSTAQAVANQAAATASDAEEGPGGRIDGYASAGFTVEYESRGGKRPRVNIKSNAPGAIAMAAHFHSQLKDGVGHLRAALYSVTGRG